MKKVKSLTYTLISKYIQSLKFKKQKTENQILASLSSLEIDKILNFNEKYDTYNLLIDKKDLENKLSNRPEEYIPDPELLKLCGTLETTLTIEKLEVLLFDYIKKLPRPMEELISLVKQKGFSNPGTDILRATTFLQHDRKINYDENADLFCETIKKKTKVKPGYSLILIKCGNCSRESQEYRLKNNGKRHHTTCKSCGRNIEINSTSILDSTKTILKNQKKTNELLLFDSLDKKIIEIIKDNQISHSQKNIAKICQKHPSTISRHIKKLIHSRIIISISKITGIYKIASNIKKIEDEKGDIIVSTIHKFKVKTWITSGTLNANFYNNNQMRNWTKKCFDELNLKFEVNFGKRTSIVFHPTGSGGDSKEAIINAKEKTKDIIEMLEKKYEIRLAIPEFDETDIHYLNIKTDPEVYNSLRNCWSDNSHKRGLETGSAEFADFLKNLATDTMELMKQVKEQKEISQMQNEMIRFQNERINNQHLNTQDLKNTILNEIDNKLVKFEKSMASAIGAAIGEALQKHLPIY